MKAKIHNFKIGDLVKIREDVDNFDLQVALLDESDKILECEIVAFDNDDENEGLDVFVYEVGSEREKWVNSEWLERV